MGVGAMNSIIEHKRDGMITIGKIGKEMVVRSHSRGLMYASLYGI